MQSQSDNTDINMAKPPNEFWTRDQIAELIDYAKYLQQENENMKANVIMMDAKLKNEEAKVKQLQLLIAQLTTFTA